MTKTRIYNDIEKACIGAIALILFGVFVICCWMFFFLVPIIGNILGVLGVLYLIYLLLRGIGELVINFLEMSK